jgi:universal stress protein family protein
MKYIIVPLDGNDSDSSCLDLAYVVGKKFKSHIEALQVMIEGRDAMPFIGQGLSAPVVEQIIHSLENEGMQARNKANITYEAWCKKYSDLKEAESKSGNEGLLTCSWREIKGRGAEIVPERGRLCDLIILPRISSGSDDTSIATVEATMVEAGRPILFGVEDVSEQFGERVTFFWNGSVEASRALHSVMPILKQASAVTILSASNVDDMGEVSSNVCDYLSWHGIKAEAMDCKCDSDRIGETLLEEGYKLNSDLFIMGSYSHSRLRQIVLGSITRYIMREATIPTIFVH